MYKFQLPPGSEEAVRAGCNCPILDNHYGMGMPTKDGPTYWISGSCPIHGDKATKHLADNQQDINL